jgi:hypothetical protein
MRRRARIEHRACTAVARLERAPEHLERHADAVIAAAATRDHAAAEREIARRPGRAGARRPRVTAKPTHRIARDQIEHAGVEGRRRLGDRELRAGHEQHEEGGLHAAWTTTATGSLGRSVTVLHPRATRDSSRVWRPGGMKKLLLASVVLGACVSDETAVPALSFPVDGTIEDAWGQARENPGALTTFPIAAVDIADGTEVRLLAGRSSNDPGYPFTTGDDVIIAEEHLLATSVVAGGEVTFPQLAIVEGVWTSDSGTLPASLLCGVTVVAARAYERAGTAHRMLAATWLVMSTPPCD